MSLNLLVLEFTPGTKKIKDFSNYSQSKSREKFKLKIRNLENEKKKLEDRIFLLRFHKMLQNPFDFQKFCKRIKVIVLK